MADSDEEHALFTARLGPWKPKKKEARLATDQWAEPAVAAMVAVVASLAPLTQASVAFHW